jgi:carbon monoxide dehydrogenase subunit G
VVINIGPIKCTFKGNLFVTEINNQTREMKIRGDAQDHYLGSNFVATAYTQTVPAGNNHSKVIMKIHVELGGLIEKLGGWLLKINAHSIAMRYNRLVAQELKRRRKQKAFASPVLELAGA